MMLDVGTWTDVYPQYRNELFRRSLPRPRRKELDKWVGGMFQRNSKGKEIIIISNINTFGYEPTLFLKDCHVIAS